MKRPTAGSLAVVRVLTASATVVVLSLAAHCAAGGNFPGPGGLLAAGTVVAALTAPLARRPLSLPVLLGLLGAGQLGLHHAFELLDVEHLAPDLVAGTRPAGQEMPAAAGTHLAEHVAESPLTQLVPVGDARMVVLHLAATLVTAVLLAEAERALWAALRWLVPRATVPRLPTLPVTGVLVIQAQAVPARRRPLLVTACPRRGPPPRPRPTA